jgi:hypothetical protein
MIELETVTVSQNGATHVAHPTREYRTLCGRKWWFLCDQGTAHYCQTCQQALAKMKQEGRDE